MPFQRQSGQTARARSLRQQENPAEASLWTILRNRQLNGHKFVRQLPIGPYYADFVCRAAKLVIEVDGSQHVDNAYDQRRDAFMTHLGFGILRFPSVSILSERAVVCDAILAVLDGRLSENVSAMDLKYIRPSPAALRRPLP
jgi:very-short-patch-repair endonuclease